MTTRRALLRALAAGALLALAGCATPRTETASMPLTYLALGDSYTIGEAVPEDGRWPVQLARALRADGIAIAEPRIVARTGWTVDELAAALDAAEPVGRHDFVTLLIGVNNQYRKRSVEDYRPEFRAMLERAIGYAGGRADRVLVLSIPDWGVTPFGAKDARGPAAIGAELDAYNAAARGIATARGVAFVDITPISRDDGGAPAMLADDGLHPSAAQYARWAAEALPVARRLLSTP